MKYQILTDSYENTGGHCMVGICEVYLPEERKTVYVLTNEEGCTLAAADYINNEFDDYDELMLDTMSIDSYDMSNKYFELYRDCYNHFLVSDCMYFNTTRCVSYEMLSMELQSTISAAYKDWADNNYNGLFETNGRCVFVNDGFDEQLAEYRKKQLAALQSFKEAYEELLDVWKGPVNFNDLSAVALYPFDKSFDELNVAAWIDATIDELSAK